MGLCPRTVGPKLHSIPSPLSRACWHTETRGSCFVSSKRNQWVEVGEGAEWNPQVIWQKAAPEEFCLWDSIVTGQLTLACVYKLARKSALNLWMLLRSMGALIKFWVLGLGLLLLLFFFSFSCSVAWRKNIMLTSFACVLWPAHHFKHSRSFSLFHVGQER